MTWLRIAGEPARQFYRDSRSVQHLTAGEARHELLTGVGAIASSVDGESANVTVSLRNTDGQCARLFATPPLRARAQLLTPAGVLLDGVVGSIDMDGAECRIGIET